MSNTETSWDRIPMPPDVRQAAIEVWNRGSADTTQMLLAVAAAIRVTERQHAGDLCADPACAQIREWYLADEVKLAKIRELFNNPEVDMLTVLDSGRRILNET